VDITVNCGVTERNPVSETKRDNPETGFFWWILPLTVEVQKETRFLRQGAIALGLCSAKTGDRFCPATKKPGFYHNFCIRTKTVARNPVSE